MSSAHAPTLCFTFPLRCHSVFNYLKQLKSSRLICSASVDHYYQSSLKLYNAMPMCLILSFSSSFVVTVNVTKSFRDNYLLIVDGKEFQGKRKVLLKTIKPSLFCRILAILERKDMQLLMSEDLSH